MSKNGTMDTSKENIRPGSFTHHTEFRDDVGHIAKGHALLVDDVGEEKPPKNRNIFKRIGIRRRNHATAKPVDVEDEDELQIFRVDTMHADIDIPLSAMSGEFLTVDHDGEKKIKVPSGYQGQSIRVKMMRTEPEESTGILCCAALPFDEEEEENPSVEAKDKEGEKDAQDAKITLPSTRVDDDHADIDIPFSAKSGEFFTVDHDGDEKKIKVPAGYQGQSIRVKMTRNEEEGTGMLCCA
jgi:hypothetical protein